MTATLNWKDKKILITGGAGFLGSHLAEELVAQGALVIVVDNFASGAADNLACIADKIQLIQGDVLSINWIEILQQHELDFFFHLVGNAYVPASVENPAMDFALNLRLAFDILESLRKISWPGRFVFPSSAAVYGNPEKLPICEEDRVLPISPYGVSKLAVERYLSVYHRLYGVNTASLRLFSVYGPRQRKLVVYDLIKKHGQPRGGIRLWKRHANTGFPVCQGCSTGDDDRCPERKFCRGGLQRGEWGRVHDP
jgi:UDP-glucose 4-epimerase